MTFYLLCVLCKRCFCQEILREFSQVDLGRGGLLHELEKVGGGLHRLPYLLRHRRLRSSAAPRRRSHLLVVVVVAVAVAQRSLRIIRGPAQSTATWATWAVHVRSHSQFETFQRWWVENSRTP